MSLPRARVVPALLVAAALSGALAAESRAQITSLPFDLIDVADDPLAPDWCGISFTWLDVDPVFGIEAAGVSLADFDNDGRLDIFLPNNRNEPSELYRNLGNGTFLDVAAERGVSDPSSASSAALFIDYDHDGDLDLLVTSHLGKPTNPLGPKFKLFRNQGAPGGFSFSDVTASAGFVLLPTGGKATQWGWVSGICAGDYDQDGWTDLFTSWNAGGISANDQWRLLRNAPNPTSGDPLDPTYTPRTFTDATPGSGLTGEYGGEPWMPTFWDANRDGWPDLHINQDFTLDLMFISNQNGTFTNVATAVGLNGDPPDFRNEMGTALGDIDQDLDQDLHLTNQGDLDRFYRNDSVKTALSFSDAAPATGLNNSRFGWGTSFADLDNDGDLDHLSVSGGDHDPNPQYLNRAHINLWPELLADGVNVKWADVSTLVPDYSKSLVPTGDFARGLAAGDWDGDGDVDLVVTRSDGFAGVFKNTLAAANDWIQVDLVEAGGSLDTTGARVYVNHHGTTQLREVFTGSSFLSQEPRRLHFGLGLPAQGQGLGASAGSPSGTSQRAGQAGGPSGTTGGPTGGFPSKPVGSPTWIVVRWADAACQIVPKLQRNMIHAIARSAIDDTGDLDADGHLNANDQALLLLATQDLALFEATYPKSPGRITGDVNNDGVLDTDDIAAWSLLPPH